MALTPAQQARSRKNRTDQPKAPKQEPEDEIVSGAKQSTPKKVVRRRGPDSQYAEHYLEEARELSMAGLTTSEIARELRVDRSTLYKWARLYPEFDVVMRGVPEAANERVVRSFYEQAVGYHYVEQQVIKVKNGDSESVEVVDVERYQPPNVTAGIFWLKNRRPHEWRDVKQIEADVNHHDDRAPSDREIALTIINLLREGQQDAMKLIEGTTEPAQDEDFVDA